MIKIKVLSKFLIFLLLLSYFISFKFIPPKTGVIDINNVNNNKINNNNNLSPPVLNPIQPNPNSDGIIYLNWSDVVGATIYYVYRAPSPITSVVGLTPIATVNISDYTDNITTDGIYYYVVVCSGNISGYFPISSGISNCENVSVKVTPTPARLDNFFVILLIIIITGTTSAGTIAIYSVRRRSRIYKPTYLTKNFKHFSLPEKIQKITEQNIPIDEFDTLDAPDLMDLLASEIGIISPEIEQRVAKLPISDIEKEEILQELAILPTRLQGKLLNQLENNVNNISGGFD